MKMKCEKCGIVVPVEMVSMFERDGVLHFVCDECLNVKKMESGIHLTPTSYKMGDIVDFVFNRKLFRPTNPISDKTKIKYTYANEGDRARIENLVDIESVKKYFIADLVSGLRLEYPVEEINIRIRLCSVMGEDRIIFDIVPKSYCVTCPPFFTFGKL